MGSLSQISVLQQCSRHRNVLGNKIALVDRDLSRSNYCVNELTQQVVQMQAQIEQLQAGLEAQFLASEAQNLLIQRLTEALQALHLVLAVTSHFTLSAHSCKQRRPTTTTSA